MIDSSATLLKDAVSISKDCRTSNEAIKLSGGRCLFKDITTAFDVGTNEYHEKSIRIVGNPAEIRNGYFPNMSI
jgi:signal recognition particle receptor subunit beta